MCELFGLCANRVVPVSFSWRGFLRRGEFHYHGWGVAWYVGGGAALVKEPRPAPESAMARFLLKGIKSSIVVSHVRFATRGEPKYVNTHPFVRELFGKEWVFAHNGDVPSIVGSREFKLEHYFPVGETDSEHAFCYIMDGLKKVLAEKGSIGMIALSRKVWGLARKIGLHGKFNFLLSNGEHLFAYMNKPGTLHYLLRHPPHTGYARLEDEDFEVRLEEIKDPEELATLIATKPLTNENWKPLQPNTLYVFKDGDLLLKVNRRGGPEHTLSGIEAEILKHVRQNPHRLTLKEIADRTGLDLTEAYEVVERLMIRKYLKQHSRDTVPPSNPKARFYTYPDKRELIDKLVLCET